MFELFEMGMKMQSKMLDAQTRQMKAWDSSIKVGNRMLDAQKQGQQAMKNWAALWGVKL